mmetsp:Transcript_43632/g.113720  ORF Transcript_43632/g.113720 Transcript_43632/m.113720 type:complete len:459 (-) Transcript_43632:1421-2797(-)
MNSRLEVITKSLCTCECHTVSYLNATDVCEFRYEEFGTKMVNYLDGIFAMVVFDEEKKRILAARDPIGIKTMVYGHGEDNSFWLASEFKAFGDMVDAVMEFPPGHYYDSEKKEFTQYYKPEWYDGEVHNVKPHSLEKIRTTIENAVVKRLMSDVPLGVLLSGGLDSSLVAAIVKRHSKGDLHTFSVGLEDSSDLPKAREVAKQLGTIHHEHVFTIEEGLAAVKDVVYHLESYDAAFIRSGVALYFLSKLAAKYVKVALSGEGADEVFAGYLYYYDSKSPADLHKNSIEKIKLLHKSNVLFVDRMTMSASLEGGVPFLDKDVLDMTFQIDPADKMPYRGKRIEKYILRKAFEGYLPDSVLWRQKEQFSDGVGYSWVDGLKDHAEKVVSDEALAGASARFEVDPPRTKEEFFIREIFEEHFPSHHHAHMVKRWIPSFDNDVVEASGRAMKAHDAAFVTTS